MCVLCRLRVYVHSAIEEETGSSDGHNQSSMQKQITIYCATTLTTLAYISHSLVTHIPTRFLCQCFSIFSCAQTKLLRTYALTHTHNTRSHENYSLITCHKECTGCFIRSFTHSYAFDSSIVPLFKIHLTNFSHSLLSSFVQDTLDAAMGPNEGDTPSTERQDSKAILPLPGEGKPEAPVDDSRMR